MSIKEELPERELHGDALKCKDIMSLLKAAGLMTQSTKLVGVMKGL